MIVRERSAPTRPSARHLPPQRAAVRVLAELAKLLQGHVPVDRALALVADQQRAPAARREVLALAAALRQGQTLSQALEARPAFFGSTAAAVARAGESAGALPETLGRLAEHLERQAALRRKLAGALVYPAVVLTVALGAVALLLRVVVPRMASLFDSLSDGAELPLPTRLLLDTAAFAQSPPGMLVLALLFAGPFFVLIFPELRSSLAPLFMRLPGLGPALRKGALARGFGTLAVLLRAGVPLPDALALAGAASGSSATAHPFLNARNRVIGGAPLSAALRSDRRHIPPAAAEVAAVGEETGTLPEQLDWLARDLEQQASARSTLLVTLVEPGILIFMALIVGLVVAALFLPILSVIENMGG